MKERVTLATLLSEHEYTEWHDGNGYTEPRYDGFGCRCGFVYQDYVQHACSEDCSCRDVEPKTDKEIHDEHLRHVLAILIRERLLTTSRAGESVTNPQFSVPEGLPF